MRKNAFGRETFGLILLISLLMAATAVHADLYTENLFDSYALENTIYTTSNKESFTLEFTAEDKIIVSLKEGKLIVENNTCSQGFNYNICFKGASFSHYNYSLPERIVNKAKITIDAITAKINITRIIPNELLISQQQEVVTTLHNVGDRDAEDVVFSDYFPKELNIYMSSDCRLSGNNVTWKGRLKANEKTECRYTINALKNTTFSSNAYATYNNGIRTAKEEASTTVTVNPLSLQITQNITNTSPDLGGEISVNLTITALKNITIEYFNVRIPPGLKQLRTDNAFTKIQDTLTYRGAMSKGDTKTFQNRLLGQTAGAQTIEISARFDTGGFKQSINTPTTINVTFQEPHVRLVKAEFSKNSDKLKLLIVNPSNHTFYDVKLDIKGFIKGNQSEEKIDSLSHKEYAYDFTKSDGTYDLETSLIYRTEFGQRLYESKTEQITINTTKKEEPLPENAETQKNKTKQDENLSIDVSSGIKKT